jgi:hypothetical protein
MALKLVVKSKGVSGAEYWKINERYYNEYAGHTRVTLGLYLNRAARLENINNVLEEKRFTFLGTGYSKSELYAKLKEPISFVPAVGEATTVPSEFATAEDIIE